MDNYIKLNSVNAGPFNRQQNIVEFEIPQGVWDLRDSYIQLNIPIANVDDEGVWPVNLVWLDDTQGALNIKFPNVALIRDASMVCDRKGRIEDIRRVDQLRTNLRAFSKSLEVKESEDYLSVNHFNDLDNSGYNVSGINGDFIKLGEKQSRMNDIVPVQIRLNDIFDFCNTPEYDTTRAGNTRIRCRLNMDRIQAQAIGVSTHWPALDNATGINAFEDIPVTGTVPNTIQTKMKLRDESEWPYYIGQQLQVNATGAAGAGGGADPTVVQELRIVESITLQTDTPGAGDPALGTVSLTFTEDWGVVLTGTQTYEDVYVTANVPNNGVASPGEANGVVVVQYAEIVLRQVAQPQGLDEISFNTYSTEQTQGGGGDIYRNLFQLEPESSNVMIIFPVNGLLSQQVGFSKYGLRLNNEDLIDDREVEIGTPLEFDRLNLGFQNLGTGLKDLLKNVGDVAPTTLPAGRYIEAASAVTMITQPIMASTTEKLLQVQLEAGAAINNITLFKELPRIFSY
tara:strand:- start:1029 stop:2564 length:1536 start_codon:yes stop_codon:yes gene_type:complete